MNRLQRNTLATVATTFSFSLIAAKEAPKAAERAPKGVEKAKQIPQYDTDRDSGLDAVNDMLSRKWSG